MRFVFESAVAIAISTIAVPALAQAGIVPGMQISDSNGGSVGIVAGIQGDNLLIKTDKHQVLLPKSSFTPTAGKLLFGMTQAQLNAEVERSLSAANAAIAVGASIIGAAGTPLGTIEAIEGDNAIIALTSGQKIQVATTSLRGNADGTVTTGLTAEQLQGAVGEQPSDASGE